RTLRRLEPADRSRALRLAAVAPVLVPALMIALCLAPSIPALFGWGGDHCLAHGEHPHLCLAHRQGSLTAPLIAVLALTAAAASTGTSRLPDLLLRARAQRRALLRRAEADLATGVMLVRSRRPFSLAAGLWRPRVWVSTALVEALARDQLDAVIEHERAHVR